MHDWRLEMNLIDSIIANKCDCEGNAIAIVYKDGFITYGNLYSCIAQTAANLKDSGVSPIEIVAVDCENSLNHLLMILALAYLGSPSMSLSKSMSKTQKLNLSQRVMFKKILVDYDADYSIEEVEFIRIHTLTKFYATRLPAYIPKKNDIWHYVVGSGSTGKHKVMPVTHHQQVNRAILGCQWLPYGCQDKLYSFVSMHFYGGKQRALEAFAIGATIYLDTPGKIDISAEIDRGHITAVYGTVFHVETYFAKFAKSDDRRVFGKLNALMLGGSYVQASLREKIRNKLTDKLFVLYGTNETHTASITPLGVACSNEFLVGKPLPGYSIDVVDELNRPLPPNNRGLIRIKSPVAINGYLDDWLETEHAFRDGYFYPGDMGFIDQSGYLYYVGREDDMMIVSGINLYPKQIEEVIRSHDSVLDVYVAAIKHDILQDIPVALVELKTEQRNISDADLLFYVKDKLGGYALWRLFIVSKIPRNEQGKLQKLEVMKLIELKLSGS